MDKPNTKRSQALRLHAHWLLYFREVAKQKSIRRAALVLNVAPSAISRQVRDVEAMLGTPLLERVPKGLRLTAAGEIVVHHASQVLFGLDQMEALLDELRGVRRGHVTIAAIQATAADFTPRVITAFRMKHPSIRFTCRFVGSAEVVQQVITGEADVGIAFNAPNTGALRHLIAMPLPFGAIIAPNHPLAGRESLRLHDLTDPDLPLILPDESISTRSIFDELIRASSLELTPAITSSYPDFIVSVVRMGGGIAFQTPVGVERELREGSLSFVPLVDSRLRPPILSVLASASRQYSTVGRLVAEAARAELAEMLKQS